MERAPAAGPVRPVPGGDLAAGHLLHPPATRQGRPLLLRELWPGHAGAGDRHGNGRRRRRGGAVMTVYVDDYRVPAQVGRISARWSHMFVAPDGDLEELHALAARIGLRRSWFQDKPWPRAHYDVTDTRRAAAIAAGAVPVSWREAGRWRAAAIAAREAAGGTAPEAAEGPGAPSPGYPALTVPQPWAWALARGLRPVENLSWKIGYKGPLWLHAGTSWDPAGEASQLVNLAWIRWTGPTTSMSRFTGTRNVTLGPDNP